MNKKLFSFFLVVLVIAVCIGFVRGWFSLTTTRETLGNKVDVSFKVDPDKMKQDANVLEEKTKSMLGSDK